MMMRYLLMMILLTTIVMMIQGHQAAIDPENHKCPICRMQVTRDNVDFFYYVEMMHGQRIHACNMNSGEGNPTKLAKFSHPSYLAIAMHKFIEPNASVCTNSCDGCDSSDIFDPSTGERVTSSNFVFVCLKLGQKIYFASEGNRDLYLTGLRQNHIPYWHVNRAICGRNDRLCPDNYHLPKSKGGGGDGDGDDDGDGDNPPRPTSPSASPAVPATSSGAGGDPSFCTGGSAMFNGFQTSSSGGTCSLLLFQPFVLNTRWKYAFGLLAVFLAAILNEGLVRFRENVRVWTVRRTALLQQQRRQVVLTHKMLHKALLALLYMLQMTSAYWLMLVVMTYESYLFLTLIAGFGMGFLLFKSRIQEIEPHVQYERNASRRLSEQMFPPNAIVLDIDGMKCMTNCGRTVENALRTVDGVVVAKIHFKERQAVVVGDSSVEELIEAVDAVGFSAHLVTVNGTTSHSDRV